MTSTSRQSEQSLWITQTCLDTDEESPDDDFEHAQEHLAMPDAENKGEAALEVAKAERFIQNDPPKPEHSEVQSSSYHKSGDSATFDKEQCDRDKSDRHSKLPHPLKTAHFSATDKLISAKDGDGSQADSGGNKINGKKFGPKSPKGCGSPPHVQVHSNRSLARPALLSGEKHDGRQSDPCQLGKRKSTQSRDGTGSRNGLGPKSTTTPLLPAVVPDLRQRTRASRCASASPPMRPLSTTLPPISCTDDTPVARAVDGRRVPLRVRSAGSGRGRQMAEEWLAANRDSCDGGALEDVPPLPMAVSHWSMIDVNDNKRLVTEECSPTLLDHHFPVTPRKDLIVFEERSTSPGDENEKAISLPCVPKLKRRQSAGTSPRHPARPSGGPRWLERGGKANQATGKNEHGHLSRGKDKNSPAPAEGEGGISSRSTDREGRISPRQTANVTFTPSPMEKGRNGPRSPGNDVSDPQSTDTRPASRRPRRKSSSSGREMSPPAPGRRPNSARPSLRGTASGCPVAFRPNLTPYPRQYIRLGLLGPDPDKVKQRQDKMRRQREYVETLARRNRAALRQRMAVPLRHCPHSAAASRTLSAGSSVRSTVSAEGTAGDGSERWCQRPGRTASGDTFERGAVSAAESESSLDWAAAAGGVGRVAAGGEADAAVVEPSAAAGALQDRSPAAGGGGLSAALPETAPARGPEQAATSVSDAPPAEPSGSDSSCAMEDAAPPPPPPPPLSVAAGDHAGDAGGGPPRRHSSHDVFYELPEQHAVHVTDVRCHEAATCTCGVPWNCGGRPLVSRATQSPGRAAFVHKNLLVMDLGPAAAAAGERPQRAAARRRAGTRVLSRGVEKRLRGLGQWWADLLGIDERPPGDH